jgi:hypothetical protein
MRRDQPGVWLKVIAMLVREHKIEPSNVIKSLSDQELESMIEFIQSSLEAQAGRSVKLIEGTIEPTAVEVTVPPALEPPKPKNRLMMEVDTAIGPQVRKPRKRAPSPAST